MKEMTKQKLTELCFILIQTVLIVGVVLLAVIPFSCKVTTEGIDIIGGDYSAPVFEGLDVIDERTVRMSFSEAVTMRNIVVTPFVPGVSDSSRHSASLELSPSLAAAAGEYGKIDVQVYKSEDGRLLTVALNQNTVVGKSYEIFGTVNDAIGNTLTFCVPFVGFNASVPKIIMTEIQIKYQKGTSKGNTVYRGEYVELLALEDGNLAGLEIISAADGEEKKYVFPAIDVSRGEIILVHFRTIGDGCINEDGENLNLAYAPHSQDGIRDLWSESTVAHFNDASDIILLRNTIDGTIIDGIMYAEPGALEWKSSVAGMAVEIAEAGIYNSADISSATSSKGCTTLKSLTRVDSQAILELAMSDEDYEFPVPCDEDSWVVTAVSPGML